MSKETMHAIVWKGKEKVAYELVERPKIQDSEDVIIKVSLCAICSGSDSHLFSGEISSLHSGSVLGHEAVGIIVEKGDSVKHLNINDRVVIPFNIACGTCSYCKREEYTGCDTTNHSELFSEMFGGKPSSAIFGYTELMGDIPGSQAEYVRVPFADFNCHTLPKSIPDEKAVLIADVLCTSYHATELGNVKEGDNVVIWGLGPIGLSTARWCQYKKAKTIVGIDMLRDRLDIARNQLGISVLDRTGLSPAQLNSNLQGLFPEGGPDVCIDAVGFRFPETITHKVERVLKLETDSPDILLECFTVVRKFGTVVIIGDYIGFANHFPIGHVMMKHLTIRSGQCPCQKYMKKIISLVEKRIIDPSFLISQQVSLDEGPKMYSELFKKNEGTLKVLLKPLHAAEPTP